MRNVLLAMSLIATTTLFAQSNKVQGDTHFQQQNWESAIPFYEKFVKDSTEDASVWFNLATCYRLVKQYEKALKSYKLAQSTGFSTLRVSYNSAKCLALSGQHAEALALLTEAANNGLPNLGQIRADTDFDELRTNPQFDKIIIAVEKNAYPCMRDSIRRKFDFWLGEWDVFANGNKVGENSITLANGGCVIHEDYTTPFGYTGQSMNYFDPGDNRWRQNWVGSNGGNAGAYYDVRQYVEIDSEEGYLQFQDEYLDAQGKVVLIRMSFTHDTEKDTVRQYIESSSDGGKTWSVNFDGLYKKKPKG